MIWFQRSLAKCFDLALFGGALHLIFQFLGVSLFEQLMMLPMLPFLFIPFEAIQLKLFHTTLCKSFFGFSYDRPFTLRSAINLSTKNAILILPLFLPLVNIFFAYFYYRELSLYPKNRWDELSKETLGKYSKNKIIRAFIVAFTLFLSCSTFAPKFTLTQMSNLTGIDYFIDGVNSYYSSANIANWKKIEEKEIGAEAYFPQDPVFSTEKYPVPKSDSKLDLKHYIYSDAAHNYSITYTTLPTSWTKWGSSLVLGVGINHVVDKNTIVYKKKCKHYNFPALEYKLKTKDKTTTGLLVLVEETMYKIEFQQNKDVADLDLEAEKGLLNSFFSSFKPLE